MNVFFSVGLLVLIGAGSLVAWYYYKLGQKKMVSDEIKSHKVSYNSRNLVF